MDNVGGILNIFFSSLSFYFFPLPPSFFLLGITTTVQLRIRL
uniref:ORF41i n=1 Tax=Pinus koraiensis TaxID=88728 RepID=A4QM61_PINKO|nr:ORF41i [Pinus koraiensis]ABP35399.1 ORF41i [Pinus koraiensis]